MINVHLRVGVGFSFFLVVLASKLDSLIEIKLFPTLQWLNQSTKSFNHDWHLAEPWRTCLSECAAGVTKPKAELELLHLTQLRRTFAT